MTGTKVYRYISRYLMFVSSPWHNPLPQGDYTSRRVVVYFYSNQWIPITCFRLSEAITLHQKALLQGKELFVFPPGLNLETKNILASESSVLSGELVTQAA